MFVDYIMVKLVVGEKEKIGFNEPKDLFYFASAELKQTNSPKLTGYTIEINDRKIKEIANTLKIFVERFNNGVEYNIQYNQKVRNMGCKATLPEDKLSIVVEDVPSNEISKRLFESYYNTGDAVPCYDSIMERGDLEYGYTFKGWLSERVSKVIGVDEQDVSTTIKHGSHNARYYNDYCK